MIKMQEGQSNEEIVRTLEKIIKQKKAELESYLPEQFKIVEKSEVETKAAFWAAVDQFEKAKSLDPSVTAKANELINAYSHSFPSVETLFFNGYEEGQEYSLENCWIGGKTKIRAAKN